MFAILFTVKGVCVTCKHYNCCVSCSTLNNKAPKRFPVCIVHCIRTAKRFVTFCPCVIHCTPGIEFTVTSLLNTLYRRIKCTVPSLLNTLYRRIKYTVPSMLNTLYSRIKCTVPSLLNTLMIELYKEENKLYRASLPLPRNYSYCALVVFNLH